MGTNNHGKVQCTYGRLPRRERVHDEGVPGDTLSQIIVERAKSREREREILVHFGRMPALPVSTLPIVMEGARADERVQNTKIDHGAFFSLSIDSVPRLSLSF